MTTTLDALNEDFRDLLLLFIDEQVDFLIVGAYALAFHGVPRATGDIDILVRPSAENARRVWRALVRFGAPLQSAGVRESDFAAPDIVYQIGLPPRRIDILTEISGVTFEDAWSSKETARLENHDAYVIGRDALIRNKTAAARLKDLADVRRLSR